MGNLREDDLIKWIVEIAEVFDEIDPETVLDLINIERNIANFPTISDRQILESEIDGRRQHFRAAIQNALKQCLPANRVKVITQIVESSTEMGNQPAPLLINDLVDSYEVETQDFLTHEEEKINTLLNEIQTRASGGETDDTLSPIVNTLGKVVKNWDIAAQPIQVSTKSRGLGHDASTRVAIKIRGVGVDLFNEHNMLNLSQQITSILQEVFAEVVEVVEQTEEDAVTLDEIAKEQKLKPAFDKILALCAKARENAKAQPSCADSEAQQLISVAPQLFNDLRNSGATKTILDDCGDSIAFTLMQCAIIYGNQTRRWETCVKILEDALKYASSQEARERVVENWRAAKQNKSTHYDDLSPISFRSNS